MKHFILFIKICVLIVVDILYAGVTAFALARANPALFFMTLPGSFVGGAMYGVHGGKYSKVASMLTASLVNVFMATVFLIFVLFVFPRMAQNDRWSVRHGKPGTERA